MVWDVPLTVWYANEFSIIPRELTLIIPLTVVGLQSGILYKSTHLFILVAIEYDTWSTKQTKFI